MKGRNWWKTVEIGSTWRGKRGAMTKPFSASKSSNEVCKPWDFLALALSNSSDFRSRFNLRSDISMNGYIWCSYSEKIFKGRRNSRGRILIKGRGEPFKPEVSMRRHTGMASRLVGPMPIVKWGCGEIQGAPSSAGCAKTNDNMTSIYICTWPTCLDTGPEHHPPASISSNRPINRCPPQLIWQALEISRMTIKDIDINPKPALLYIQHWQASRNPYR